MAVGGAEVAQRQFDAVGVAGAVDAAPADAEAAGIGDGGQTVERIGIVALAGDDEIAAVRTPGGECQALGIGDERWHLTSDPVGLGAVAGLLPDLRPPAGTAARPERTGSLNMSRSIARCRPAASPSSAHGACDLTRHAAPRDDRHASTRLSIMRIFSSLANTSAPRTPA